MGWGCVISVCHWVIQYYLGLCICIWCIGTIYLLQFSPEAGKTTFSDAGEFIWGRIVLVGIILCMVGIIICGKAGVMKEKAINAAEEQRKKV